MRENKEITDRKTGDAPAAHEAGRVLRPPMDIFEDAEGITAYADIPGVAKEGLKIQVDNDTLFIEGTVSIDMPEGTEPLHADIRCTTYRREFRLSGELETRDIDASLKDGVLTLRIPKRAEVRPRKIDVRVD